MGNITSYVSPYGLEMGDLRLSLEGTGSNTVVFKEVYNGSYGTSSPSGTTLGDTIVTVGIDDH